MFFFFGDGIGVGFLILGPFLIFGGLRRPRDRRRLVYSGLGSMVVGLGNILMPRNLLLGVLALLAGVGLIVHAARQAGVCD